MTLARTFYKLLVAGLALLTLSQVFWMVHGLGYAITSARWAYDARFQGIADQLAGIGLFLILLSALYFVPVLLRKYLPEIR